MNDQPPKFSETCFVKSKLLQDALYREDEKLWNVLRAQREEIRHYFFQIGQELVLDEGEGFAFLRQIEVEEEEKAPRLVQRRSLSYDATLLLVCLREEFLRFDSAAGDSTRLVLSRTQLHNLVSAFLKESNNQVRDGRILDAAISRLAELGFLRALAAGDNDAFQVMRVVKARLTPAELEAIKEKLLRHAESGT